MDWLELVVGAGYEESAGGVEGKMIGGHAGFEGSHEQKWLGVWSSVRPDDLGGATRKMVPVRSPTKRLPWGVEGDAGGDAEAFGIGKYLAGGRDAIDDAFGAGAAIKVAVRTEGQAGWR